MKSIGRKILDGCASFFMFTILNVLTIEQSHAIMACACVDLTQYELGQTCLTTDLPNIQADLAACQTARDQANADLAIKTAEADDCNAALTTSTSDLDSCNSENEDLQNTSNQCSTEYNTCNTQYNNTTIQLTTCMTDLDTSRATASAMNDCAFTNIKKALKRANRQAVQGNSGSTPRGLKKALGILKHCQ